MSAIFDRPNPLDSLYPSTPTPTHIKIDPTPGGDAIDLVAASDAANIEHLNYEPKAAKTAINQLAIELIALVNQQAPITDFDVHEIRKLSDRISSEATALYK